MFVELMEGGIDTLYVCREGNSRSRDADRLSKILGREKTTFLPGGMMGLLNLEDEALVSYINFICSATRIINFTTLYEIEAWNLQKISEEFKKRENVSFADFDDFKSEIEAELRR